MKLKHLVIALIVIVSASLGCIGLAVYYQCCGHTAHKYVTYLINVGNRLCCVALLYVFIQLFRTNNT
jgi:ABC-type proline/glycine betaine transport system permease subunit